MHVFDRKKKLYPRKNNVLKKYDYLYTHIPENIKNNGDIVTVMVNH